jgi:hypothetical protein
MRHPGFSFIVLSLVLVVAVDGYSQERIAPVDPVERGLIIGLQGVQKANDLTRWLEEQAIVGSLEHISKSYYFLPTAIHPDFELADRMQALPFVTFSHPNQAATLRANVPNDTLYFRQLYHKLIGSEQAWDISTGGASPQGYPIVVAVFDDGFDRYHEDIVDNLWINPGEIPNDGIDNDNNGFVDDYDGYNPHLQNGSVPVERHGHSVTGYIGARGNNITGIAGINWEAQLMVVGRALSEVQLMRAFEFILHWRRLFNTTGGAQGAYIVALNMSIGFDNKFPVDMPWLCEAMEDLHQAGILVVASAPNVATNIASSGDLPCLCATPNLICVTNTTIDDELVSNAGFSSQFVHLGAPGHQSFTVDTGIGAYRLFGGTSAAAPMVTGTLALLASMPCTGLTDNLFADPPAAASILRQAVLDGVKPLSKLAGITITGGRLCLWCDGDKGAVTSLSNLCGSAEGPISVLRVRNNPTRDMAFIDLRSPGLERFPVRIYNVLGQIVWEQMFEPEALFESKLIEVNTASWASGVYMVKAGDGRRAAAARLLVIH